MEEKDEQELVKALANFSIKEHWDKFINARASNGCLEWYAEWPQISQPLLACLSTTTTTAPPPETSSSSSPQQPRPLQILIPFCGSSGLSEHVYDAGFHYITNIDFSKAVISEMLRRNVRSRPEMLWRAVDMTDMKFVDEIFDVILDKGGLDALMEPLLGPKYGNPYLVEVKRVLQKGGKFICLTLGEPRVLGILFPKFRYGWRVSVHALPLKPSNKPSFLTFMVIAEKESSSMLHKISLSFDPISLPNEGDQVFGFSQVLETENRVREEFSNCSDILYTLEDLRDKGDLKHYWPGLRIHLSMGDDGRSLFVYRAVFLDSPPLSDSEPFLCDFGVYLVPKTRGHEWLFCSEEGQWTVVEVLKAARLIMVFLDSCHTEVSMEKIQEDLTPLINQLEPSQYRRRAEKGSLILPYWGLGDWIKKCELVHQVTSSVTGLIIVEEVPEKVGEDFLRPAKDLLFRRLTFKGSQNPNPSQALLKREESLKIAGEKEGKYTHSSKSKKRGNRKKKESHASKIDDSSDGLIVDHDYLASPYHAGIISGFVLISSYLERMASTGQSVTASIIGLGAGLLPMFLHGCLPFLHISVVEYDPVVRDLARDFFSFKEDERLKVHVPCGKEAEMTVSCENEDAGCSTGPSVSCESPSDVHVPFGKEAEMTVSCENEDAGCSTGPSVSCETPSGPTKVGEGSNKVDIFIVDSDSFDSSSGLACPSGAFVDESFFVAVKDSISEEGLFIIHLLSRTPAIRASVISRLKTLFCNIYILDTKYDGHEVIFVLGTKVAAVTHHLPEASKKLKKLLKLNNPITRQLILDGINNINILN